MSRLFDEYIASLRAKNHKKEKSNLNASSQPNYSAIAEDKDERSLPERAKADTLEIYEVHYRKIFFNLLNQKSGKKFEYLDPKSKLKQTSKLNLEQLLILYMLRLNKTFDTQIFKSYSQILTLATIKNPLIDFAQELDLACKLIEVTSKDAFARLIRIAGEAIPNSGGFFKETAEDVAYNQAFIDLRSEKQKILAAQNKICCELKGQDVRPKLIAAYTAIEQGQINPFVIPSEHVKFRLISVSDQPAKGATGATLEEVGATSSRVNTSNSLNQNNDNPPGLVCS